jgi:hypothetical protein
MNAPTPREQELEAARNSYATQLGCEVGDIHERIRALQAQNKALWELVGECEKALKAAEAKFERLSNFPPPEFCFTLAAIQKAKESKV